MAILINSMLEGFHGKIGEFVLYQLHGRTYIRRRPYPGTQKPSPLMVAQRERIAAVAMFYRAVQAAGLYPIWQMATVKSTLTGYNLFVRNNLPAFTCQGQISDFNKLQVSTGGLRLPDNLSIRNSGENEWTLEWENRDSYSRTGDDDRLQIALMMCEDIYTVKIPAIGIHQRHHCQATFRLDAPLKSYTHLFCYFCSAAGGEFSVSRYFRLT